MSTAITRTDMAASLRWDDNLAPANGPKVGPHAPGIPRDLWEAGPGSRGGYRFQADAAQSQGGSVGAVTSVICGRTWTVAQWLRYRLTTRESTRSLSLPPATPPV